MDAEGVDLIAVPIDEADDNAKLGAFAQQWKPPSRLINLPPAKRAEALAAFAKVVGRDAASYASVITDNAGHILSARTGVPSVSELRSLLMTRIASESAFRVPPG